MFAFDELQQLPCGVFFLDDGVADVGPVKAAHELPRALQPQPLDDVGARERVSRGGEGNARHAGPAFVQQRQRPVFGAEVVPPLAHAVRFVDGEKTQLPARVQRIQQLQKARRGHALGRGVQQRDVPRQQLPLHGLGLAPVLRGIEEAGGHASFVQRVHLVLHEGDERRDDQRDAAPGPLAGDGRNLVAQRFAAARGHEHQRVAAARDVFDDVLLLPPEAGVAEDFAQDVCQGLNCGHGG